MLIKLILITCFSAHGHKLRQVYVLSRHNLRSPLSTDLRSWSPKPWPSWNDTGHLTDKGRRLERYMGKYFADWMIEGQLFKNISSKEVFIYANNVQRTIDTAKSFVEGFGDGVQVYFKNETDPVFNFHVKNTSTEFKEAILYDMRKKLSGIDVKDALLQLDRIVDFGNSTYCRTRNVCDLSEAKSEVVFEGNKIPDIKGAFRIGKSLVDAFLMAYYEGMPSQGVAWGEIRTDKQWEKFIAILNSFQELRFQTKLLDRDISSYLLDYFVDIFQYGENKFYLLVGHDSNILALMSTLRFKTYVLHNQYEKIPIGGKLVFQKWRDEENDLNLLRVSYVYQSADQIRDGAEISLKDPPQWETLEIEGCAIDKDGFCPWNDFLNILSIL